MVASCLNGPRSVQDRYYFWDLHTSTAGYRLVAAYAGAMLRAPYTVAATAELAAAGARNFTDSLITRLDTARLPDAALPRRDGSGMARTGGAGPVSVFVTGTGGGGWQDTRQGAYGYSWSQGGINAGAEAQLAPNLRIGAAFGYSRLTADLKAGQGDIAADLYNLGAFAAAEFGPLELDGVLAYGWQDFSRVRRPAVVDESVDARPDGGTFSARLRGAWMFGLGATGLRAGPVLGLAYADTELDGYTEAGDALVTQRVGRQEVESLIGTAGAQIRGGTLLAGLPVVGRLALAYEHDFIGSGRDVTTTFTGSPLLPIRTRVEDAGRSWGRISAGIAAQVAPRVSLGLEVQSTFGRGDGDAAGIFGSLRFAL